MAPINWFATYGLSDKDRGLCKNVVRKLYIGFEVQDIQEQGQCSYTLLLKPNLQKNKLQDYEKFKILQFRPSHFDLDITITQAAKQSYRELAPTVKYLGSIQFSTLSNLVDRNLKIYEIEYINGISYNLYSAQTPLLDGTRWDRHLRLITEFAGFIARAWPSFVSTGAEHKSVANGKVGSCMKHKLSKLTTELPTSQLQSRVRKIVHSMWLVEKLPIVITHGDTVPANILVDTETGALKGLVDWAEAEMLPFGVCLYGLEYLLGYYDHDEGRFIYYFGASQLRDLFWQKLVSLLPPLQADASLLQAVMLARDIGVLLWFGYAWDDGRINRVVNNKDDPLTLHFLETFLS